MTYRDFIHLSLGNLWRMKLRSFLTVSGVVIAIAAFVSMLSPRGVEVPCALM